MGPLHQAMQGYREKKIRLTLYITWKYFVDVYLLNLSWRGDGKVRHFDDSETTIDQKNVLWIADTNNIVSREMVESVNGSGRPITTVKNKVTG